MKKGYIYTLLRVLELAVAMFVFIKLSELAMWMMNLASSIGNAFGILLLLATAVTGIFYIYSFGNRIRKYLENL